MTAARWAIACDFDATATMHDVGDGLAIRFAGAGVYQAAEDDYRAGSIDFATLLVRLFGAITASREEIAEWARAHGELRPGFVRLIAHCRAAGRPFLLSSAGMDVYIDPVLEQLPRELRDYMTIHANRGVPSPDGLQLHFPGAGTGCGRCGSCKRHTVESLQRAGYRVAFVGDGTSDRCAADVADMLFARAGLLAWCRARDLPHHAFDTLDDVIAALP